MNYYINNNYVWIKHYQIWIIDFTNEHSFVAINDYAILNYRGNILNFYKRK